MTELTELTIADALKGLEKNDFSSADLTEAHIKNAEAQSDLNVFITTTFDQAREQAKASDKRRKAGETGALEGIPLAIKDLYCTKGVQTTAASRILEGFIPPYESTVSQNLWNSGAVMVGKTSLDEFAMGSANTTAAYGHVINPWKAEDDDSDRVPGGSSGGSSAAVAARMAMGATGTDTGGSIRQPAAYTGIVGLKPTYGRCSRWGIIAFASSLDQAGPMTRSVEDAALMLGAMAGYDPKDSTSVDQPVPDYTAGLNQGVKGKRIGIPKEYRIDDMPSEVSKLWEQGAKWLEEQGAEIVEISLPHTQYALPTYYIIAPAEASSNLARYDGMRYGLRESGDNLIETYMNTRAAGFGDEVKRRILIGTYVLSAGYYDAYYVKAQKVRKLIAQDFEQAFETVDAVLSPTAPTGAFPIGEKEDDPVKMYLNDIFTVPAPLAGLPGISVPAGLTANGLPLGLQLVGRPFAEAELFQIGRAIEQAADFKAKPNLIKKAA